jgi:hypothetical protein
MVTTSSTNCVEVAASLENLMSAEDSVTFYLAVEECDSFQLSAIEISATTAIINTGVQLSEIANVAASCADGAGNVNRRERRHAPAAATYSITVLLATTSAATLINTALAACTVTVFANGAAVNAVTHANLAEDTACSQGKSGKSKGSSTSKAGKAKSAKSVTATPSKGKKGDHVHGKTASKGGKSPKAASFTQDAQPFHPSTGGGRPIVVMVASTVVGLVLVGYYHWTRKHSVVEADGLFQEYDFKQKSYGTAVATVP